MTEFSDSLRDSGDPHASAALVSQQRGMPRIAVIVPVFNASAWIESCIQALLNQDYDAGQFDIILVDNNSSDDSKTRIQSHARVRLLEETFQSSYAARNRGVRESRGDLLAFTDADCVPAPNWLSVIAAAMRNEKTQAVLGSRGPASASGPVQRIATYEDARLQYILENRRQRSYFGFTSNMAVRRSAFERYGPFDTIPRGGDTLFLQRLAAGVGPEAAEWIADMRIRHLEMRSAWTYLKKSFIYGHARKRTKHLGQCENLTASECLHIFRSVSREWPASDMMTLAFVLSTGRLSWIAGSLL
jgi:glycosyltransferase involved in cell wall biosynthesis